MADRFHCHHFATIDSTQIEARKPQYKPGDIITADRQTAGYGRRGRSWEGPSGNLAMTMVEEYSGIEQLSWTGYAVGLALYETIQPLLNETARPNIKWPNDLLIDQLKLSGMLLEVENNHLLIGIGMNIAAMPETDQPVTILNNHTKIPAQLDEIVSIFLDRYQYWFEQGKQQGFSAMREAWLSHSAFVGQEITARLADGTTLTGVFNDIDHTGALVLATENGQYKITAADIYLTKK